MKEMLRMMARGLKLGSYQNSAVPHIIRNQKLDIFVKNASKSVTISVSYSDRKECF